MTEIDRAVHAGNAAIADQVEEEPELDGMGTTLTAILFAGKKLGLAHIGDSRAYLFRDNELAQITRNVPNEQTHVAKAPQKDTPKSRQEITQTLM